MRSTAAFSALLALAALSQASPVEWDHSHDGHSHEEHVGGMCSHSQPQIPLGYVKFPQQVPENVFYKSGAGRQMGATVEGAMGLGSGIPGDGEPVAESVFAGIGTFSHLPYRECLKQTEDFDIAFLGLPFDTGTSYRPGARFGPSGIRQGSRRLTLYGGYNVPLEHNPFTSWAKVVDCGDVFVTSYDNAHALRQMEEGHKRLLHSPATTKAHKVERDAYGNEQIVEVESLAKDGKVHPRVITMGGDHTITLPIMRSMYSAYGALSVIHFDSHLDTWKPKVFGGSPSSIAAINHGTYWWHAAQQGLVSNGTSIHAGIRTTLSGPSDYVNDAEQGFKIIEAREIDTKGTDWIIKKIRDTVGTGPVYLSIDIDTLDPSAAPATGTPETGGWSTRELRTILRGLDGLMIVGADLVEVAPPFDTQSEQTTIAAADILYEVMTVMSKSGPAVKAK